MKLEFGKVISHTLKTALDSKNITVIIPVCILLLLQAKHSAVFCSCSHWLIKLDLLHFIGLNLSWLLHLSCVLCPNYYKMLEVLIVV